MISADEAAFAAVRVMGTCFATGHSAGVAAAVQAEFGEADIRKIRAELDRQGALLEDILVCRSYMLIVREEKSYDIGRSTCRY